jgi:hypothetical protein
VVSWCNRTKPGAVAHTDKVTTLKVETVQFIARLLRIHDILVYDERCAFRVVGDALADLAGTTDQQCVSSSIQ